MTTREKLKKYFEAGDKPTQQEFYEWLDSYWHKEDKIPQESLNILYTHVNPENYWQDSTLLTTPVLCLTVPEQIKSIALGSFAYDTKTEQIVEVVFNDGLEIIGMFSFYGQNIRHIKTPPNLKSVEPGVFQNQEYYGGAYARLEKITLNEGLISIASDAFNIPKATFIRDLYIPSSVTTVSSNGLAIASLETVSAPAGLNLSTSGIPANAVITYR